MPLVTSLIASLLLAASVGLSGNKETTVYDTGYDQAVIKVKHNQKVIWRFDQSNSIVHTVTYESGPKGSKFFNSGDKGPGEKFSKKLKVKGAYTLYCLHHPGMIQKVKVR